MNDIMKPADNMKVAEIGLMVDRAGRLGAIAPCPSDVQSLIERIKLDDKKIRQLEKMNGITWLGDEQKEKEGKRRTAAELYKDKGNWPVPIGFLGGVKEQAYWHGREDGAREMEKEYGN